MATTQIVNLSDPNHKRMLLDGIRALEGTYRFEWCKHRPRRTDRQNRYYWPAFVQPFADYLRQSKDFTDEMAHEVLKRLHLEATIIDKATGQYFTYVRSTTDLDTTEFNEYLDKCAATLADCGIPVPGPIIYREEEPTHTSR